MSVANTGEMTRKSGGEPAWTRDAELVSMALQLRTYAQNAAMNLLQMGRVLAEAKERVSHGEWEAYVKTNAKMSPRTAQSYMQAYAEFGLNPRIAELGSSQIIRLLPMTAEEREKLMTEHDVSGMSVREMDAEIRKIRETERNRAREALAAEQESSLQMLAREKAGWEQEKRRELAAAEKRVRELEEAIEKGAGTREIEVPVTPPELVKELNESKAEIDRLAETNRELMEGSRGWMKEKTTLVNQLTRMKQELDESEETIREQQKDLNEAQEELLNMKSLQARGEERNPGDTLTAEIMTQAAREFIGICARGPHMHRVFATIEYREWEKYREVVSMMRGWVEGMEEALDTVAVKEAQYAEGGVVIE